MALEHSQGTSRKTRPGLHYPLGAIVSEGGVNFAVYSEHAEEVFLVLFDRPEGEPTEVISLGRGARHVWHVFVDGVRPGQLYGYKVHGQHDPARGLRFNDHKLLVDPYAKAVAGKFRNAGNLLLAYDATSSEADLGVDTRDDTRIVPKSVVVHDAFDWQGDSLLHTPVEQLVIYETHVRGFTAHPSSQARSPGTYLGFVEKIPYLQDLGVNAVLLLPVQEFAVEDYLVEKGLTNYWGYNPIAFFAPESSYGSNAVPGCQVAEFKTLVRELHKAGIEVLLDVTFRHTAEGNELGPTMSFRGLDNPTYYCLTGEAYETRRRYAGGRIGSGNALNLRHPQVIRLLMDCLRYWVDSMHVDGFRMDFASLLGHEGFGWGASSPVLHAIGQDPVLCRAKFLSEPWDRRQAPPAAFLPEWTECNPRFRDTVRRFVRGEPWQAGDLGFRLTGSADLYGDDGRSAFHGVNFVTSHNGFTLHDLVSYVCTHNEGNAEQPGEAAADELSINCGTEGETRDVQVLRLRRQMAKNHACMLLFALGTPMILGGDEFLRTQYGNANTYCQDNELSWYDWDQVRRNGDFLVFVRKAIAFRRSQPLLQAGRLQPGEAGRTNHPCKARWIGCDLEPPSWEAPDLRTLALVLEQEGVGSKDPKVFRELLLVVNADATAKNVRLPPLAFGACWLRVVDTSLPPGQDFADPGHEIPLTSADAYLVNPRSTVLLATW